MRAFKKSLVGVAVIGAMAISGSAAAADSQTMTVSAKVLAVCYFSSSAYTMTFADINPHGSSSATQTTAIGYKCTKGTPAASITFDTGATGNSVSLAGTATPSNTMPVTLAWTTPTSTNGTGFGTGATDISFNVTGTITAANYANMPADTYTKAVTVAITP